MGHDTFAIVNLSLDRVAEITNNRLTSTNIANLKPDSSNGRAVGVFKVVKHIGTNNKPTTYTFHHGSTDLDLISEEGNLGDGAKIILGASGGDHVEWSRWEFELI